MNLIPAWSTRRKVVVGMLRLRPLPGSPRYGGDRAAVRDALLRDADALAAGGARGLMMEACGDVPFYPARVPARGAAEMAALASEGRRPFARLPLGGKVRR